jgi:hypothetical protein
MTYLLSFFGCKDLCTRVPADVVPLPTRWLVFRLATRWKLQCEGLQPKVAYTPFKSLEYS